MTALMFSALSLQDLLVQWVAAYGIWALGLVALVIFAETGLVVAPFLPGDSLLFLTGTVVAASTGRLHASVVVLIVAAILGDAVNFAIGRRAAPVVMRRFGGRWLRPAHLDATRRYFDRFGSATIVIARFVPIVRTMAPFLAGAGAMPYRRFALFNVAGAVLWVSSMVYAGALLGSVPFVQQNLSLLTLAVVGVSLMPIAVAAWKSRGRRSDE